MYDIDKLLTAISVFLESPAITPNLYFAIFNLPIDIYIDEQHEKAFCRHLRNLDHFSTRDIEKLVEKKGQKITQKMAESLIALGSTEVNLKVLEFCDNLPGSLIEEIKAFHERNLLEKDCFIF